MKFELGHCLLNERLIESGRSVEWLAKEMLMKPERLYDYMENKRVMPLKMAISISDTLGCDIADLYELIPNTSETKRD